MATAISFMLIAVFAAAASFKIADWDETVQWVSLLRFKRAVILTVAGVGSEFILIGLLATVPRIGAAATIVWLAGASALLVRAQRLKQASESGEDGPAASSRTSIQRHRRECRVQPEAW